MRTKAAAAHAAARGVEDQLPYGSDVLLVSQVEVEAAHATGQLALAVRTEAQMRDTANTPSRGTGGGKQEGLSISARDRMSR